MYGKKYKFYNPLKQNYGHIKALQSILSIPEDKFISIVAFSSSATIKVKTTQHVVYISKLKKTICQYNTPVFAVEQLDEFVARITNSNIDSRDMRKVHVRNIKSTKRENRKAVAAGVCSKCGGELVERKGKYGSFLGCSNFPKCRFTKN